MRSLKPYTKDDRRRDFQKQQWRNRVDAQMQAAKRGTGAPYVVRGGRTLYRFPCQNCNAALEAPASPRVTCPYCGFAMWVRAGKQSHSVGPADPPKPIEAPPKPIEAPKPTRKASTTSELERLAKLHRSGALTDAEFAAAKAGVLGVEVQRPAHSTDPTWRALDGQETGKPFVGAHIIDERTGERGRVERILPDGSVWARMDNGRVAKVKPGSPPGPS